MKVFGSIRRRLFFQLAGVAAILTLVFILVVRGVAGDVPLATVFRGVLPFIAAMIIALGLIIAFPGIALVLPNSMFG